MALTDTAIKNAKPGVHPERGDTGGKPYKLSDSGGLFLLVQPNGSKWWRLKYRIDGKEGGLSLGVYPEVSLKVARKRRDDAREQIANGLNPGEQRQLGKLAKAQAAANSFEVIGSLWFAKTSPAWRSKTYVSGVKRILECDVYPYVGKRPITEIKPREMRDVFQRIRESGREETARRTRVLCGQVFRYAVGEELAEIDPTQSLPHEKRIRPKKHFAAFTDPSDVKRLMQAIQGYSGTPEVKAALQLSAMLFQRPGEIRRMDWREIDLDGAQWRYTVTKTMTPHIVPLPAQAVAVLRSLIPLTGTRPKLSGPNGPHYVLPNARGRHRPMSENGVRQALRTLGFTNDEMTAHGFRAMARSLLSEQGWKTDAIERQLSHKASGPLGAAYDRAAFLTERKEMMQSWANYLDELAQGTQKVAPRKAA